MSITAAVIAGLSALGSAAISRKQDSPATKESLLDWTFPNQHGGRPGFTRGTGHYHILVHTSRSLRPVFLKVIRCMMIMVNCLAGFVILPVILKLRLLPVLRNLILQLLKILLVLVVLLMVDLELLRMVFSRRRLIILG